MSYVYRFIDKDYNCLYVGFSNRDNIYSRMGDHFSSQGHLPKECYDRVAKIDYKEYHTKDEGLNAEKKYIKKYSPIYNTIYNSKGKHKPMKIILQEDWVTLTNVCEMSEIPQFVRTLQWMYLSLVGIFGIVALTYMITHMEWTLF